MGSFLKKLGYLFGNVSSVTTYPGIFNISLSISIAHQSIDISKFSVSHLKKLLNEKKLFQVGLELAELNPHY